MRLNIIFSGILILGFGGASACVAQETFSATDQWTGEWGAYSLVPPHGLAFREYLGERIAISDCAGSHCKLEMTVETGDGHCDTSGQGTVTIQSSSSAMASLSGSKCTVTLRRSGTEETPVIQADNGTPGCSDFCTPGASFNRAFPLRSRTRYFGDDIQSCYLGTSPAQMAICKNKALADQEYAWRMLALDVADLEQKNSQKESDLSTLLAKCDPAADPVICMKNKLDASIADLNQRKQAWLSQVTAAGSPEEASRKIAAISGRYRHSFTSGDVQGDTFKAVDKLQIAGVSGTSIHYSLYLNFYNGHTCSREGTAVYKANGAFIDEVKDDSAETCYFEIIPTSTGVRLNDPNGACKAQSCGARGGYNGAGFSFAQRVRSAP